MNAAAPKVVIAKISFLMLMNDSHARPKRPVAIRSLSTWRPAASSTQFLDQRADLVPINLGRDRTHLLEHNPPLSVDDERFGNAVDAPLEIGQAWRRERV